MKHFSGSLMHLYLRQVYEHVHDINVSILIQLSQAHLYLRSIIVIVIIKLGLLIETNRLIHSCSHFY